MYKIDRRGGGPKLFSRTDTIYRRKESGPELVPPPY